MHTYYVYIRSSISYVLDVTHMKKKMENAISSK